MHNIGRLLFRKIDSVFSVSSDTAVIKSESFFVQEFRLSFISIPTISTSMVIRCLINILASNPEDPVIKYFHLPENPYLPSNLRTVEPSTI